MSIFVMSDEFPQFCKIVESFGNTVIASDRVEVLNEPEQRHTDMQILAINDKIFLLKECKSLRNKLKFCYNVIPTKDDIGRKYPECVKLNGLFLQNRLFCKSSSLDNSVKEYCKENNIKIINVNQGYSRCSTAIIGNKAAITSDPSIYNALKKEGIEALKINPGHIVINGYDYGFIGGASINLDENRIAFFGDISLHPDYPLIENFCKSQNVRIISLCKGVVPVDIGGAVKII